jgi:hypothetical protein
MASEIGLHLKMVVVREGGNGRSVASMHENEILSISFYLRRYSVQDELYPPPFETLMCHMANAVLSAIRVVG